MVTNKLHKQVLKKLDSPPKIANGLSQKEVIELMHELKTHQTELEVQNEELLLLNKELKKEKEMAQMYLDIAETMLVVLDKNREVTLVNQKTCEILGYKKNEIIGKNWFDNFSPKNNLEDVKIIFEKLVSSSSKLVRYKSYIITKSGEERLILWKNILLTDEYGETTNILSSGEDITEQREAEKRLKGLNIELEKRVKERTLALEESQQLYKMIARNFPNGVINVLDKKLKYVFVEGMEMFKKGITGDLLVGTSFLNRVNPKIRGVLGKKLLAVFKGENTSFELKTDHKTFMMNVVGLHDENNNINQILMVSQNITAQKKAEDDIKSSLEKEIYLNELKSRFVSIASHEFRTPLTSIMNSVSLLSRYMEKKHNTKEKQGEHLKRIKTSIYHLTSVLNDFLSLDKLEDGKIEMNCTTFNLSEFSQEILKGLDGMKINDHQITYHHQGEIDVCIDKQILKNIFNNLLSNAIKYSPKNTPIKFDTIIKNGILTIIVQDYGIGIPKREQKHLFERFFRANNTVNIQGTGLGLNIIKKYLDMIDGKIYFESEPRKGSTFTLKLPVQ